VEPDDRLIKPDFSDKFLTWVQSNPGWGLGAILIVIAAAVVSLVPIGTPLTLGCGYIYRGVYGWKLGLLVSTVVSMAGSTLGAVTCFLLGRYLMRDTVKRWVRNYPMFDAIDVGKIYQFIRCLRTSYMKLKLVGPIKNREKLLTLLFLLIYFFCTRSKINIHPWKQLFPSKD
jgi:membrane protein YqaA with SNARE-associated domain